MKNIAEKLKLFRKEADMTQLQLAKRSHIAYPTIQKYEGGKFTPKQGNIDKLAAVLNIPVQCFLSLDDLITNHSPFLLSLPIKDRLKTLRYAAGYDASDLASIIVRQSTGTDSISMSDPSLIRCQNELLAAESGNFRLNEAYLTNISMALGIPEDILVPAKTNETDSFMLTDTSRIIDEIEEQDRPIYMDRLDSVTRLLNNSGIQEVTRYAELMYKIKMFRKYLD